MLQIACTNVAFNQNAGSNSNLTPQSNLSVEKSKKLLPNGLTTGGYHFDTDLSDGSKPDSNTPDLMLFKSGTGFFGRVFGKYTILDDETIQITQARSEGGEFIKINFSGSGEKFVVSFEDSSSDSTDQKIKSAVLKKIVRDTSVEEDKAKEIIGKWRHIDSSDKGYNEAEITQNQIISCVNSKNIVLNYELVENFLMAPHPNEPDDQIFLEINSLGKIIFLNSKNGSYTMLLEKR